MWFLFKILHVKGRNTCLCKGELCFILLGGVFTSFVVIRASFSFLYTGLVTILLHTLYFIFIYIWWWRMFSSPISTCVVSFLSLYTCFFMNVIFISVSHMIPWWVLFKCFRKTGCESLSCRELFSYKVFQEFVVGTNLLL